MKTKILGLLAVGLLGGVVARANTAVVNFDSLGARLASYSEQGVTFTAVGGGTFSGESTPNGTLGLLSDLNPRQEFRADIAGGTSFVSVDLGDFDGDPDTLFLEVFNIGNVSLGFTSQLIEDAFVGMVTLSLSNPNIAYAVFGARAPAINGSSVFADNFTWSVPEPGTLALLGLGLVGLGLSRRRKAH